MVTFSKQLCIVRIAKPPANETSYRVPGLTANSLKLLEKTPAVEMHLNQPNLEPENIESSKMILFLFEKQSSRFQSWIELGSWYSILQVRMQMNP